MENSQAHFFAGLITAVKSFTVQACGCKIVYDNCIWTKTDPQKYELERRRNDIQHNDTHQNDIPHNDIRHNDTQQK
jgi:hypothetical protein